MVLPDASVWIDYFNNVPASHVGTLLRYLDIREVVTTDVVVLEVLQGFRSNKDFEAARKILDGLVYRPFWGKRNMEMAASNYRLLRQKGITIRKPNDVVIGTLCIEHGYSLLHNDQDFNGMEKYLGLKVIH